MGENIYITRKLPRVNNNKYFKWKKKCQHLANTRDRQGCAATGKSQARNFAKANGGREQPDQVSVQSSHRNAQATPFNCTPLSKLRTTLKHSPCTSSTPELISVPRNFPACFPSNSLKTASLLRNKATERKFLETTRFGVPVVQSNSLTGVLQSP